MGTATIKPETAKNLRDTDASVKVVDQLNAKIQPVFKNTSTGLESAIKDSNGRMIELYRPKLEKVVDDIDNCMSAIEGALALIGFLQKDEDFMADRFELVERLLKKVTATQKKLTEQLQEAKELDKRALKALNAVEGGQEKAVQELAVLKDQVADLKKAVDYVDQQAPKLEQAAKDAFGKRDQKGLTDARLA